MPPTATSNPDHPHRRACRPDAGRLKSPGDDLGTILELCPRELLADLLTAQRSQAEEVVGLRVDCGAGRDFADRVRVAAAQVGDNPLYSGPFPTG
jgi:hypothetical protein